jgi:hypothetical protein
LQSARTIDRGHERRSIDFLLKMRVNNSGNSGNAALQFLRYAQVVRAVAANCPNIDLRRQPKIENLGDHVGRLEIERFFGKFGRQHLAQLADVAGRWRVLLLKGHQNHTVIGANC